MDAVSVVLPLSAAPGPPADGERESPPELAMKTAMRMIAVATMAAPKATNSNF
jgi:hypothetical protein